MKIETNYIAKDGKKFDSQAEAEAYEVKLDEKATERYLKFINNSHNGRRLLQEHTPTEEGVWEVIGESDDPGPGGGRGPNLGLFEGRLIDVIHYATAQNAFWAWGGGGTITKVKVTKL